MENSDPKKQAPERGLSNLRPISFDWKNLAIAFLGMKILQSKFVKGDS
jgi:hypothetical protein